MSEFIERGKVAEFLNSVDVEDEHLETKAAANNIPKDAWESISAFANSSGGVLLLGVSETDSGFVASGVSDANRLKHDLQTGLRNLRQISHEVADDRHVWTEPIEGRDVLVAVVPEARRAHKPVFLKGNTDLAYFRRGSADVQCNAAELKRLLRESQQHTSDNDVIDYLDYSDLDTDAIRRYRVLCRENGSRHLDGDPSDVEFLTRIGVWRRDREQSREGLTRGGVLVFGDELAIREIRPNHVIDYRLQDSPVVGARYRDRARWTGHLFGAWEEIAPKLIRNLPIPFRLTGVIRRDEPAGEQTVREALMNLLIHTDYLEFSDARIIFTGDAFWFDNPGSARVSVDAVDYDAPDHFAPSERRNPLLSQLFAHAGLAELAGSGVRSMRTEWKALGYQPPKFSSSAHDYRFSVNLSLRSMIGMRDREWLESVGGPWVENEELALLLARDMKRVDNQQLREVASLHPADATRVLQGLRDKGVVSQSGYGKGSHYVLAAPPAGVGADGTEGLDNDDQGGAGSGVTPPHKGVTPPHKHHGTEARDPEHARMWQELVKIAEPVSRLPRVKPELLQDVIVQLCGATALSRRNLAQLLDRSSETVERTVTRLIKDGRIRYLLDPPSHSEQKYAATPTDDLA